MFHKIEHQLLALTGVYRTIINMYLFTLDTQKVKSNLSIIVVLTHVDGLENS